MPWSLLAQSAPPSCPNKHSCERSSVDVFAALRLRLPVLTRKPFTDVSTLNFFWKPACTLLLVQVFTGGLSSYTIASMCMAHLQAEGQAAVASPPSPSPAAAAAAAEAVTELRAAPRAAVADAGQLLQRFLARFGSEFKCVAAAQPTECTCAIRH